jgi:hypothetical protein
MRNAKGASRGLIAIAGLLAPLALVAPQAWAGACVDGATLNTYIALGTTGCTIGDKTFSNFSYSPSGTEPVAATGVTVDTVGPSGESVTGPNLGVQFTAPWDATTSSTQTNTSDGAIQFAVSITGGGPAAISDTSLATTAGVVTPGFAQVGESGCSPAPCTPVGGTFINLTATGTQSVTQTFLTPTGSLEVAKDITVSSGVAGQGGSASLTIVQDTFSQVVPAPLIGHGLLVLLAVGGVLFGSKLVESRRNHRLDAA